MNYICLSTNSNIPAMFAPANPTSDSASVNLCVRSACTGHS